MPDVAQVEIEGLPELISMLDAKKYQGALVATLWACAEILKDGVATYPPETEANQPRPADSHFSIKTGRAVNRWYVRGKGTVTSTGRVYLTSEDLGGSWTINVKGLTAEIGNRVSYGPYVQGDRQAWYHGARGWKTIYQVVREKTPQIARQLWIVVDRLLSIKPSQYK